LPVKEAALILPPFRGNLTTFPREDPKRRVERKYLRFAGVGVQFGLTIFLLTLLGIWIDGRLGTKPLFTVVLLLVGFLGGTWSLVRQVLGPNEKK
jgi:F0F1-type ATP synthase assembly protein I